MAISHPDGRPLAPEEFPAARALKGENVVGVRYRLRDAQGAEKFILATASPLIADGMITGVVATWHDVTEQERLLSEVQANAQALREARDELELRVDQRTAELEAIFASLPDATYMGNENGIQRCNQAALDILGCDSIQDLWDKIPTLAEKIQNRDVETGRRIPTEREPFVRALQGESAVLEMIQRNLKTGQDVVVRSACAPIIMNGQVIGAVAINTDISDQKRIQTALSAQAETLREQAALLELTHDAILVFAMDGIVRFWNRGAEERYGWTREEAIGQRAQAFLQTQFPEPLEQIYATLLERNCWEGELVQTRRDGTPVSVACRWALQRDAQGAPLAVLEINNDITDRKRAEEESRRASLYARSLIEASLDPLVTISPEGKITDVNEATERATGVSRQHLIGSDFSDYFTEPDKARAGYQQVLAQGLVRDYSLTIRHASEGTIDVLYNASVYRDETGDVQGVFAAARDVTERKRAEEEFAPGFALRPQPDRGQPRPAGDHQPRGQDHRRQPGHRSR